jgi:hypothetical protein
MDWHDYVTSCLVQQALGERRAAAARERLLQAHRLPRPPLRLTVGTALIRLGSRLIGAAASTELKTSYRQA